MIDLELFTWHGHVGRVKSRNARSFWSKVCSLAGWVCGLSTSFPISLTQGGQNPGTRFRLLVTSGRQGDVWRVNSSSFFGVKRLTYKGLTYKGLTHGSLINVNCSYTRMDTLSSFGNLSFKLINFVDRKIFLSNILKQESWTWRAREQELCLQNSNGRLALWCMKWTVARNNTHWYARLKICFAVFLYRYFSFLIRVMKAVDVRCRSF